jgi:hypothetical protein
MFACEQEVRVVLDSGSTGDPKQFEPEILGYALKWAPEENIEWIRVHPDADDSFMETVISTVAHYAPALESRVTWSAMIERPPF